MGELRPNAVFMAVLFGGQLLLHIPSHLAFSTELAECGWVLAAFIVGLIVHELGHAVAVLLVGERVLGIEFGGKLARRTLHLGTIPVSVGLGLRGRVTYPAARVSPARRAIVVAAGPLASLLIAPLCLLLPLPRWETAYLALVTFASAVMDLVPGSTRTGSTDGAKLWQTRELRRADAQVRGLLAEPDWLGRPDAADILINGFGLGVLEAVDCLSELGHQPERLLRLYLQLWTLPDEPQAEVIEVVRALTWDFLADGDVPSEAAELAADRAEWVLEHVGQKSPTEFTTPAEAQRTLGLARLRQGRPGEVRRLCADALAADLEPGERASVLATLAMSRHARQVPARELMDEALALDPEAPLAGEAVRVLAQPWDETDPVPGQGQMAPGSPA